jgi:hypothetical protein
MRDGLRPRLIRGIGWVERSETHHLKEGPPKHMIIPEENPEYYPCKGSKSRTALAAILVLQLDIHQTVEKL